MQYDPGMSASLQAANAAGDASWTSLATSCSASAMSPTYLDYLISLSHRRLQEHRDICSSLALKGQLLVWLMVVSRRAGAPQALPASVAVCILDWLGNAWDAIPISAHMMKHVADISLLRLQQELDDCVTVDVDRFLREIVLPYASRGEIEADVIIPGDIFKMIRERYSKKVCNGLPPEAVVAQKFKQLGYQYDAIKWMGNPNNSDLRVSLHWGCCTTV
mmetsp:Transcript_13351/g.24568  ORF Transcript_13351/g.24568 Transcript_13351/m.24568 type:complete len:219 (+) Transcript_13351:144-800(+)